MGAKACVGSAATSRRAARRHGLARGQSLMLPLEQRRLLSGAAPVAAADNLVTDEDHPLVIGTGITSLHFESQAGDPVGRGVVKTWTTADGAFDLQTSGDLAVDIEFHGTGASSGDEWMLNFLSPDGDPFTTGTFDGAIDPRQDYSKPGLEVVRYDGGIDGATGRFT